MSKYEIILYWSFDVKNVERVIQEWLETAAELGREIPEPKGRLHYA